MKSQSISTTTKKTTKKKGSQICTNPSSSSLTQQIASVFCFVLLPSPSSSPTKVGLARRERPEARPPREGETSKTKSQGLYGHQPYLPVVFRASTDAVWQVPAAFLSTIASCGFLVASSSSRPSSISRERNKHQRKAKEHQREIFPIHIRPREQNEHQRKSNETNEEHPRSISATQKKPLLWRFLTPNRFLVDRTQLDVSFQIHYVA